MTNTLSRRGVALLITLFFIIAITAAVGVSLMNLRKSGEELHQARFLLQSGAVIEDILSLIREADKLGVVTDAESLNIFLLTAGFIPLELKGLLVKIEITSAMGRININALQGSPAFQDALMASWNSAPERRSTSTTVAENPHCGKCLVPFMKSTTSLPSMMP